MACANLKVTCTMDGQHNERDEMISSNVRKYFPGGFVFLDRSSRMPLDCIGKSRSKRAVIKLSDGHDLSQGEHFPLQLPFTSTAHRNMEERGSSMMARDERSTVDIPLLTFRSSSKDDDSDAFIRRHYNDDKQKEALRHHINNNSRMASTDLMHHMDPEERVQPWESTPVSPASCETPCSPPTTASQSPTRNVGGRSRQSSSGETSSLGKMTSVAVTQTPHGSLSKPSSSRRLNPRARAA